MAKQFTTDIHVQRVTGLALPSAAQDAVNKAYCDAQKLFPFYRSNGSKHCIPTVIGGLPFVLADTTPHLIPLGC